MRGPFCRVKAVSIRVLGPTQRAFDDVKFGLTSALRAGACCIRPVSPHDARFRGTRPRVSARIVRIDALYTTRLPRGGHPFGNGFCRNWPR